LNRAACRSKNDVFEKIVLKSIHGMRGGFAMQRETEERDGCRLITLAKNHVAHVQRCAHCGAIALHLGPVTLRFDEGALESVWGVIGQALAPTRAEPEQRVRPSFARTGQA
jgi:hypothetical protein